MFLTSSQFSNKQMMKIQFEQLLRLQDVLDERTINQELTVNERTKEWETLLAVAGYTEQEYEELINDRWNFIFAPEKSLFNFHCNKSNVDVVN